MLQTCWIKYVLEDLCVRKSLLQLVIVDVAVVFRRGKLFHASFELKDVHLP